MPDGQMTRPVYDVLAEVFWREKVKACFALQGDANMCFATRLADMGCNVIHVRHEHCTVSAATSYARKTGEVGVATVTCGPGMSQIMTALTTAVHIRTPLVVFAGEAPMRKAWYNQKIDQGPYITATGAAYIPLHHVPLMPQLIRDAFIQARREQRPIVIGVPADLQEDGWNGAALPIPSHELMPDLEPMAANEVEVKRAAQLVDDAKKIVVVAGLGAARSGALEACRAFAAKADALLGSTLPNRGYFRDDPFNLGIIGGYAVPKAKEILQEADLIISVGCSMKHHNTLGGKLHPKAQMLQVDVDPIAISQGNTVARNHMRADARLGIEALTNAIQEKPTTQRTEACARTLAEMQPVVEIPKGTQEEFDPRAVVTVLNDLVPDDWEFVNTSGHVSSFTAQMPGRLAERFLTIREFGTIGNGTSFATGVAVARPDKPVVLLDGDGSLLMHLQELETIARHKLKILVIAMNDGAYTSETHKLEARGLGTHGCIFGRTDFAAVGRSLGLGGHTITDLADLPEFLKEFENSDVGAVWDVPITDRVISPIMADITEAARKVIRAREGVGG